MSKESVAENMAKMKMNLITAQKSQLHGLIDLYVEKNTPQGLNWCTTEESFSGLNLTLDSTLIFLMQTCAVLHSKLNGKSAAEVSMSDGQDLFLSQELLKNDGETPDLDTRMKLLETVLNVNCESGQFSSLKLLDIERNIQELRSKCVDLGARQKLDTVNLKVPLDSIEDRINDNQRRFEDLQKQAEEMKKENSLNFVSKAEVFDVLEWSKKNTSKSIDDLVKRLEDIAESLNKALDFNEKIDSKLQELQLKLESAEKDLDLLKNKETLNNELPLDETVLGKVDELKTDLSHFKLKLDNLDSLSQEMCQMLAKKVIPICKLEKILNEKQKFVSRLTLEQRVSSLELGLNSLELKSSISELEVLDESNEEEEKLSGFTAYLSQTLSVSNNTCIEEFTDVLFDEGDDFSTDDGEYTAPVDGIYLASVTLRQVGGGRIRVHVKRSPENGDNVEVVCKAMSCGDGSSASGLGIVRLDEGDKLFVKVVGKEIDPELSPFTSFSCCLLA